jgi:hypothetical protein
VLALLCQSAGAVASQSADAVMNAENRSMGNLLQPAIYGENFRSRLGLSSIPFEADALTLVSMANSDKQATTAVHEDAPDDLRRKEHALCFDRRDVAWVDVSHSGGNPRP